MLDKLIPNVIEYLPDLKTALWETFQMMVQSGVFVLILGTIFGIIIVTTRPKGILANRFLCQIFDKLSNLVWSIPFIVLYIMLSPVVEMIVGAQNNLGVPGAIIPLIVGGFPFYVRQVESALSELDPGLIEAAQAMGVSNTRIIFSVYLKESIPGLARGAAITLVVLFGLTTIAGSFGAGGLGAFVLRYGHQRNMRDILYSCVFIIILLVSLIQGVGNFIARKTTH